MIDGIVKILEKVIQLLERREKQKRSLFFDYVEPMYLDMEKIHSHYLTELTCLLTEYLEGSRSSSYFKSKLQSKKTEMEYIRAKVQSIAKHQAYSNKDNLPEEVAEFMSLCLKYFRITSGEIRNYIGYYTDLIILVDNALLADDDTEDSLDIKTIERQVDSNDMAGYDRVPLNEDPGYLTWVYESKDGKGNILEHTETRVPTLQNLGTLGQNLDITLAYIRISWDEITDAYAVCQTKLL